VRARADEASERCPPRVASVRARGTLNEDDCAIARSRDQSVFRINLRQHTVVRGGNCACEESSVNDKRVFVCVFFVAELRERPTAAAV